MGDVSMPHNSTTNPCKCVFELKSGLQLEKSGTDELYDCRLGALY